MRTGPFVDLAGRKIGRLTALRVSADNQHQGGRLKWDCRCDCGTTTSVMSRSLLRPNHTTSCGCRQGSANFKHGSCRQGKVTREFRKWSAARGRCYTTTDKKYPIYGGRGIKMCDRWRSFSAFLDDMGPCPAGLTLERIDVNGNYEPNNCRWATKTDQSRNKRTTRLSVQIAADIRLERQNGVRSRDLAIKHGVSVASICAIVRGAAWV